MNRTLAILLMAACSCSEPAVDGHTVRQQSVIPDSIRTALVRLGDEDQAPRAELTPEKMQDRGFAQNLLRGDSARSARLRAIVERYGWPDSTRAGADAASAAFLVLQHSPDKGFQKTLLPELERLAIRGLMPRADVAMLVDRVLMHDGLAQRYGTQFTLENGRWVMHPVEEEAELDGRRAAMGLPPMDEYIRLMAEFYQAPVVR